MSIYRSRTLSRYGAFGAAFGGFEVFPGGPSFTGGDSFNIFFDDGTTRWAQGAKAAGVTWVKPSPSVLKAAAQVWADIDNVGSPADAEFKERLNAQMNTLAASIDTLAASHDIFGYSNATTVQLVSKLKDLKTAIQRVAAYQVTPMPTEHLPTAKSSSSSTASGTSGGAAGGHDDGGHDSGGIPWLYIGLGLGGLALVAGGLTLLRPKRVAGYSRRRR